MPRSNPKKFCLFSITDSPEFGAKFPLVSTRTPGMCPNGVSNAVFSLGVVGEHCLEFLWIRVIFWWNNKQKTTTKHSAESIAR